jgi:hypothetical protein
MSILDNIRKKVDSMSAEDLRKEFAAIKAAEELRRAKIKEYNAKEGVKEKRLAYSKAYREKNPDKFKESRKAYMSKPEVKEKMKARRLAHAAHIKAVLAKAKELGIA